LATGKLPSDGDGQAYAYISTVHHTSLAALLVCHQGLRITNCSDHNHRPNQQAAKIYLVTEIGIFSFLDP
jgi:hypothetical protein